MQISDIPDRGERVGYLQPQTDGGLSSGGPENMMK